MEAGSMHVTRWGQSGPRVVLVHGGAQGSPRAGEVQLREPEETGRARLAARRARPAGTRTEPRPGPARRRRTRRRAGRRASGGRRAPGGTLVRRRRRTGRRGEATRGGALAHGDRAGDAGDRDERPARAALRARPRDGAVLLALRGEPSEAHAEAHRHPRRDDRSDRHRDAHTAGPEPRARSRSRGRRRSSDSSARSSARRSRCSSSRAAGIRPSRSPATSSRRPAAAGARS